MVTMTMMMTNQTQHEIWKKSKQLTHIKHVQMAGNEESKPAAPMRQAVVSWEWSNRVKEYMQ